MSPQNPTIPPAPRVPSIPSPDVVGQLLESFQTASRMLGDFERQLGTLASDNRITNASVRTLLSQYAQVRETMATMETRLGEAEEQARRHDSGIGHASQTNMDHAAAISRIVVDGAETKTAATEALAVAKAALLVAQASAKETTTQTPMIQKITDGKTKTGLPTKIAVGSNIFIGLIYLAIEALKFLETHPFHP